MKILSIGGVEEDQGWVCFRGHKNWTSEYCSTCGAKNPNYQRDWPC